ncbi:MAG TPA: hypothetical protein VJ552_11675 [Sediminibacterium sp.]|nr:hypothetical protein [Sediminibacterium sp.]
MTPEEYQLLINLVMDRYHTLNLTFEQAEKVYKYEQEKDTYSAKHFFSAWEEWDYELSEFRQILNEEQLASHENYLNGNSQRYKQSLVEQDSEKEKDIACYEEQINFYETQFLPDFFKDPYLRFSWLLNDNAKIEYLRTEYKLFLNDTKKEILINHFRHYRVFKPNELKVALLQHKLSCLLPNYRQFKCQMDEPTKAVALFFITKHRYLPDNIEKLLARKFKELKIFNEAIFKKYYSDIGGWRAEVGQQSDEEENESRVMALLLLDEGKYGY